MAFKILRKKITKSIKISNMQAHICISHCNNRGLKSKQKYVHALVKHQHLTSIYADSRTLKSIKFLNSPQCQDLTSPVVSNSGSIVNALLSDVHSAGSGFNYLSHSYSIQHGIDYTVCLKKTSLTFLAVTLESTVGFSCLAHMLLRK